MRIFTKPNSVATAGSSLSRSGRSLITA